MAAHGGSTPARLRGLATALVVLCLLTALASVVSGRSQGDAVGEGGTRLAALDYDTAELYESLTGADASATAIAADGTTSQTALARYGTYLTSAYLRLDHARSLLTPDEQDAGLAETIAFQLPRYTAATDAARAERDADPQGAATEFVNAATLMRSTILPAADALQRHQQDALAEDYGRAGGFPVTVAVAGLATLLALGWASIREARRTKRVLNLGLLAAGILTVLALAWWLVATLGAAGQLEAVRDHNAVASHLGQVRIAMLKARAVETGPQAPDTRQELALAFADVLGPHGLLDAAQSPPSSDASVRSAVTTWRSAVDAPDAASEERSRIAFVRLTTATGDAIDDEQRQRTAAIASAGAFLGGLAFGPGALMVLAAVAAALGIRVRVREYRR